MAAIHFGGKTFNFPEGTTREQMEGALTAYQEEHMNGSEIGGKADKDAGVRANGYTQPPESYLQEGEALQSSANLAPDEERFVGAIAHVETGGLSNRFIRTKERPSGGNAGSSAYGTYQITHGLLSSAIANEYVKFTEQELAAANDLMERQKVALSIGGRDRVNYQAGGRKQAQGQQWARQYGYEDVEAFLDDFDYGGTLGLGDNPEFQVLYDSIGIKLLMQHLRDANGDEVRAAAVWHGGPKGAGKKTENYKRKFRNAWESDQ